MADYGLLATGFSRMRMPEIKAAIVADLKTRLGLDFDTDPQSVTGQFISVFAERETSLWEVAEAVYSAMYPPSAFGVALDDAVSFVGVRRIPAARTTVDAVLYGTFGTVIPANSVARSTNALGNFLLTNAVSILSSAAVDYTLAVAVMNSTLYTITIDGLTYSYTSDSTATLAEILSGLTAALASVPPTIAVTTDAERITFRSAVTNPFNISFTGPQLARPAGWLFGCPGNFYAQDVGPIDPPVGTLTQKVTAVSGWDSVFNPLPASPGRYVETDSELRARYPLGVFRTGAGSLDAIAANLREGVPGVTFAQVYQNLTNSTDADGRPAHSVEAVVVGGKDQDIFNMLLKQVAAGIETYGTVTGTALDSSLVSWTRKFSRPAQVLGWAKVTVTKYTEETLPDNAGQLITNAVVTTGNSFGVGKDAILQRFMGPIYASVAGIGNLAITIAKGAAPVSGDYAAANIAIGLREISVWDASRVTVTIL